MQEIILIDNYNRIQDKIKLNIHITSKQLAQTEYLRTQSMAITIIAIQVNDTTQFL